jgi:uncharacterized protein (DUF2147 family)
MMRWKSALTALAALAGVAVPAAAQKPGDALVGLWLNPHHSVAVRAGECAGKLCGWIAWANAEAKQDGKDGGVPELIGTELLQDYDYMGEGNWSGTVFVPDMGRHFSSTITLMNRDQLKVKGCLIGGFFCKSQVWQRIERLPNG